MGSLETTKVKTTKLQTSPSGATQFLTTEEVKLIRMVNLKTGEIIPF